MSDPCIKCKYEYAFKLLRRANELLDNAYAAHLAVVAK